MLIRGMYQYVIPISCGQGLFFQAVAALDKDEENGGFFTLLLAWHEHGMKSEQLAK